MADEPESLEYSSLIELKDDLEVGRPRAEFEYPDRRDGRVYRYDPPLKLAVEVALVTGRPLLIRGKPGSGKSSLAAYVARNLGWRYYEHIITARTQARDLLWTYDVVRRLANAQTRRKKSDPDLYDFDYVEPGVLWWAFDRATAPSVEESPKASGLRKNQPSSRSPK